MKFEVRNADDAATEPDGSLVPLAFVGDEPAKISGRWVLQSGKKHLNPGFTSKDGRNIVKHDYFVWVLVQKLKEPDRGDVAVWVGKRLLDLVFKSRTHSVGLRRSRRTIEV